MLKVHTFLNCIRRAFHTYIYEPLYVKVDFYTSVFVYGIINNADNNLEIP